MISHESHNREQIMLALKTEWNAASGASPMDGLWESENANAESTEDMI